LVAVVLELGISCNNGHRLDATKGHGRKNHLPHSAHQVMESQVDIHAGFGASFYVLDAQLLGQLQTLFRGDSALVLKICLVAD
jgi:hypothetical protein